MYKKNQMQIKEVVVVVISVHNTYCVKILKCSLSYTADYTDTCPKSPLIFWLIRR